MKCENCGKNEVSFVYQSNINGKVTEKHLCSECARELGYAKKLADHSRHMMQGFFGSSLLNDFFTPTPSLLGRMNRMLEDPFDDFFAEMPALTGTSAKQEPQTQQKQEQLVNEEEQSRFARIRQRNALRMEMKRAVREENFERAAELRDQLRALEAQQEPKEADK